MFKFGRTRSIGRQVVSDRLRRLVCHSGTAVSAEQLEQRVLLSNSDFPTRFVGSDSANADLFGQAVAVSGNTIVSGALQADIGVNLLLNGSFEEPAVPSPSSPLAYTTGASINPGWFIEDAQYQALQFTNGYDPGIVWPTTTNGTQYMYLGDGPALSVTTMSQSVSLQPGAHALRFDMATSQGNGNTGRVTVDVHLDGVSVLGGGAQVFDLDNGFPGFVTRSLTFNAPVPGTYSVRLISSSGKEAFIDNVMLTAGAPATINSGAAYLFDALTGTQLRKLVPADPNDHDQFGISVAIHGNYVLIGATGDDDRGENAGAAYLFNHQTGALLHKFTANDGAAGDTFGYSLDLNGTFAVIGAFRQDTAGSDAGAAYVFNLATGQQVAKLTGHDTSAGDEFGRWVAVSGDRVLIAAPWDDTAQGVDAGSAYLFDIATGQQLLQLTAPNGGAGHGFGLRLDLNGSIALIGTYYSVNRAYVYDVETGEQTAVLTALDTNAGDWFGVSVALTTEYAFISAMWDSDRVSRGGSVYQFALPVGGTPARQIGKFSPLVTGNGDYFGEGLAANDAHLVVGSPGASFDESLQGINESGAVYVRPSRPVENTRDYGLFDQQQFGAFPGTGNYYGYSVAASGDRYIVGVPANDPSNPGRGGANIHSSSGTPPLYVAPFEGPLDQRFGWSVAIDGDIAVVGAPRDGALRQGSVSIFNAVTGALMHKIWAPDGGAADDGFGWSVSISGDLVVVGAPGDDDRGSNSGSVYIFSASTGYWWAKLTAPDGAAGDEFGSSVSISGVLVAVGAVRNDDRGTDSGSVYTFTGATGNWLRKLTAPDGAVGDWFGRSVCISGDVLVIGSFFDDDRGTDSGSVYIFRFSTGALLSKLTAPDGTLADRFGNSVSISDDLVVVGANNNDSSGSAYVFSASTGALVRKLTAPDRAAGDDFGFSVSISRDLIVVGAPFDDNQFGTDSGSVYTTRPPIGSLRIDPVDINGHLIGSPIYAPNSMTRIGTSAIINEGGIARFKITRDSLLLRPLRVYFNISGEADPGDFQGSVLFSGFIDIPQGTRDVTLEIPINADGRPDVENQFINERLILTLDTDPNTDGQQGDPTGDLIRDAQGRWVPRPGGVQGLPHVVYQDAWIAAWEIVDIDARFVRIYTQNATGGELSGDSVSFRITRGGDVSQQLTVDLDVSGTATLNSDYIFQMFNEGSFVLNGTTMTVTIPAGVREVVVTALPFDDLDEEGVEWLHIELLPRFGYTLTTDTARRQIRLGIIDDDMPSVLLRPVVGEAIEGGAGALQFLVVRGGLAYTNSPLTANIALDGLGSTAQSGLDYIVRLGNPVNGAIISPTVGGFYQIHLAAGIGQVDVFLVPINDELSERDERILARLISGETYLPHPTLNRLELIIREDASDRPLVWIEASDPWASETNFATGEFVIRRSGGLLSQSLEVRLSMGGTARWDIDHYAIVGDGTEFSDEWVPNAVYFAPGQFEIRLLIRPLRDALIEGTESATLTLLQTGLYNLSIGINDQASVFITDLAAGQGTQAIWDWSMPERYGLDRTGNRAGSIADVVIPNTPEYVNPAEGFPVRFDGGASTSGAGALGFAWKIFTQLGNLLHEDSQMVFQRPLLEAIYIVTLRVTDVAGVWSEHTQLVEVDDILIVSAGDSVASGEGNPTVSANNYLQTLLALGFEDLPLGQWADDGVTDQSQLLGDPEAYRHTEAYAHAAAHRSPYASSSLTAMEIERRDPKSSVTFVFVAQTGASVMDGFLEPKDEGADGKYQAHPEDSFPESQLEQIARLVGDREIDSMLISLGANDIGFSDILASYVARVHYRLLFVFGGESRSLDSIALDILEGLATLPGAYEDLSSSIASTLGPNIRDTRNTFLQQYFDPTAGDDGQPADVLGDVSAFLGGYFLSFLLGGFPFARITDLPVRIDSEEAAHGREHAVLPLNAAVQLAASSYGWSLIPVPSGFSTRGYSASTSWIRSATESRILQGGGVAKPMGAVHPNAAGHQAYSASQLSTYMGDGRAQVYLPEVVQVVEGGSVLISSTVGTDPGQQLVGELTYEWDLDYDGTSFTPHAGVTGSNATFSANTLGFPATGRVAVRVTDRLGRSTFDVATIEVVNGNSGRYANEVRTVDAGTPFWLGLERVRQDFDPAFLWRIDWGDGSGEVVPADWLGRSHVYSNPGLYSYRVWLTDAAGEVEVQGGTVSVFGSDPFPTVSVVALDSSAAENGGSPLRFQFFRSASPAQMSIPLSIAIRFGEGSGLAANGVDFVGPTGLPIPQSVFFPAGQSSVTIEAFPVPDADQNEGTEIIELSISPSSLYAVSNAAAVTSSITDSPSTELGALAGMVFDDVDGDGLRGPGEAALPGWQVGLDANGNGVIDIDEEVALSGPDGRYLHPNLPGGVYRLLLSPQGGWVATTPLARTATVGTSTTVDGQDFSVARPVTVRGSVFRDDDIDGERGMDEPGRAGVFVWVDSNFNGAPDVGEAGALSGPDGTYEIANAAPGSLAVRALTSQQWVNTNGSLGGSVGVTLLATQTADGIDLGQRLAAPIIGSLVPSAPSVSADSMLVLDAMGVSAWTRSVRFWRESNGTIGLQSGPGGDTEIGRDNIAGDGWSLTLRAGLDAGSYLFYAVAESSNGVSSDAPAVASVEIVGNSTPTSVGIRALNSVVREGGTLAAVFEVFRVGNNASPVAVNLAAMSGPGLTTDGVDHPAVPSSLIIGAGQDTVRLFVPIPDDDVAESEEQLRIEIVPGSGYDVLGENSAGIAVRDASTTPDVVSVVSTGIGAVGDVTTIEIGFSGDVGQTLTAAAVRLQGLSTGMDVPASQIVIDFDPVTGLARVAVPSAGEGTGTLDFGDYRLTLTAAGIADTLGLPLDGDGDGIGGGDFVFDFSITDAVVWDGEAGDGNWENPLNWLSDSLPGNNDHVVVPASTSIRVSSLVAVGSVSVEGTLVVSSGGSVTTSGSFTVADGAALRTELSGPATFGRIVSTGEVVLDGRVEFQLVDGYIPSQATQFEFITGSVITGAFAESDIFAVATNLKTPLVYESTRVRLLVTSIADWNNDLSVGVPDIFAFLSSWFAGQGDFDGDGSNSVPDIFAFLSAWFSAA